jgi:predicted metal-dependent enzyme (double-stranded beta helix superfamily)
MSFTPDMSGLHKLSELPPDPTLQEAIPVLARLVREPAFLDSYILPLAEQTERAEDWYVVHCDEDEGGSYSLQIFVWPPGSKTQVHDHSSWGAFCCVVGSLSEERYERLDYGCRPDHARLRMLWRRVWKREDRVSTLLPCEGGIHRVGNPTGSKAISVHLYGPRTRDVDGRDYDPSRDYVGDRRESDARTDRSPFARTPLCSNEWRRCLTV